MDLKDKTLINEENQVVKGEIIVTFYSEETSKNYVIYTTGKQDNNLLLYAASFNEEGDSLKINSITDDQEWKIIEKVIWALKEVGQIENTSIFSDID